MRRDKPLSQFVSSSTVTVKLLVPTILAIGALLFVARSVEAAPVYSQITPAEPGSAFSSNDTLTGQKSADNFILVGPGPVLIRSLRFIGGYGVNNPPPSTPPDDALPQDSFRIVFLEDVAGSPGVPIVGGDFSVMSAFSRTPTGGDLLNGIFNPIEHIVDLGTGVLLNDATEYWITIANDPGPDHGWAWARANGLTDNLTAATFDNVASGSWTVGVTGGMWFELNDQNIPEPSSFVIVLMALSAMSLRRRPSCFSLPTGIAVLVSAMSFVSSASAAPVYSQITPSEPGSAFSSHEGEFPQIVADNFKLNGFDPVTVRSLRFIGGYGPSTPPLNALPPDDFRVVFMEDNGGIPGIPVPGGDIPIGSAYRRTLTGGQLLNGVRNPIEFILNFDSGITLDPAMEYWIAITNSPGPDHGWVWARANGILDDQTAVTFSNFANSSWITTTNGGMWFELGGQNVPEPTSVVILLTSLATGGVFRWRRCLPILGSI